ncbi:MAG TPA: sigma-54 dependent transcriptional regulator [Caldisericia bacterium]|nr:sigma-54 dependent transcriptional regulator [Caldisericia bacterium]
MNIDKKNKVTILIVDDEENILNFLEEVLKEDYLIIKGKNGKEAIKKVQEFYPDVVLMDYKMPGMDGMEAFLKIKEIDKDIPVILMTAYGTSQIAIQAMKEGAYDYVTKPLDIEEIKVTISKAIELKKLSEKIKTKNNLHEREFVIEGLIGKSQNMQDVYKLIGKASSSDVTVLILGESGTGKELVAKSIYMNSERRDKPYVTVNCAAIPEGLLESELFGHEKGAFTDAKERHIGKFEQAKDGTIFLDEIGDMSLQLQAKILRVLQEKCFERVGGTESIFTNARVIAATNKDLQKLVNEKKFREDLYYRLNVFSITVPPLRDRKEDIPDLVEYFIFKYSHKYQKMITGIAPDAMEILNNYSWPGNVRELENAIAHAVVVSHGQIILKEHLPQNITGNKIKIEESKDISGEEEGVVPLNDLIAKVEKDMIVKALKSTNGNKSKAARLLGISRKSLFNKIRDYNINIENIETIKED